MIWDSSPFQMDIKVEKCIYSSVMEALEKHRNEFPEKKALISAEDNSHFITFNELPKLIHSVEVFLHKIGFVKGDVAAVFLPNLIENIPYYIGVIGRGGIFTGIVPTVTKYELKHQLADSGASVVLTTGDLLDTVKGAIEIMEKPVKIFCIGDFQAEENVFSWDEVIKTEGVPPKVANDITDPVILPYSSGTTGLRKGVILSHFNLMSGALLWQRHGDLYSPRPQSPSGEFESVYSRVQIATFPAYHCSGKLFNIPALLAGSTTVFVSKFDLKTYLENIQKYKPWNLVVFPPIILQLVKDPIVKEFDVSSLGYIVSVGAPLGEFAEEFATEYPNIFLTQAYAMTECLFPTLPVCKDRQNYKSCGSVSPGFQLKIVDPETGKELGLNENGELLVKGPTNTRGYLNRKDATEELIGEDGWLHTGDIGHFKENGEFYIVDRKKEMIKVNGVQVAPAEIESVLASDPRIKDVGVTGLPHPQFIEIPIACVVKNDPSLDEKDVHLILKEKLAAFKFFGGIVKFVDDIPKLPSGKIIRRQLKEYVVEHGN